MRVYPTNSSIDNLEETYYRDNKVLLLERKEILKFFRKAKKDIDLRKYKLFEISNNYENEIILVKENSLHQKVLDKLLKKRIKTYTL